MAGSHHRIAYTPGRIVKQPGHHAFVTAPECFSLKDLQFGAPYASVQHSTSRELGEDQSDKEKRDPGV